MRKTLGNKKGFTLMEIIVVLIILAVLAAALVPSFVNFARDAGASTVIAEANLGMLAAQAVLTEVIASGADADYITNPDIVLIWGAPSDDTDASRFSRLVTGDISNDNAPEHGFSDVRISDGGNRITGITYTTETWTVVITGGQSAVATRTPATP